MRDGVTRKVLREIGLHHGHPHLQQPFVLDLEPGNGFGVGEVDGRTRLGKTMHQGGSACLGLHQEAATFSLGAHLRVERNIGALPETQLEAERSELLDHAFRIRKR